MDSTSTVALLSTATSAFWGYISGLFSPLLLLGLGIAFVSVIFYFVVRAPRKIF